MEDCESNILGDDNYPDDDSVMEHLLTKTEYELDEQDALHDLHYNSSVDELREEAMRFQSASMQSSDEPFVEYIDDDDDYQITDNQIAYEQDQDEDQLNLHNAYGRQELSRIVEEMNDSQTESENESTSERDRERQFDSECEGEDDKHEHSFTNDYDVENDKEEDN